MMKVILLIFGLVLMGTASATSTYDAATNIITVANGVNYPWNVYSDVSNSTAFNRTGNTSTMTANMTINSGATLYINDETFQVNSSWNGEYIITISGTLDVNNSAITGLDLTNGFYRSEPNTYQNTSTIILSGWSFNSDYTYENIKYRYYTDGTRTIIGRNPLETDKVIFTDSSSWPVPL